MKQNIGFLGAGNMGQALIEAWLSEGVTDANSIYAANRTPGKLKKLTDTFGVHSCATNEDLVDTADVVILAMKPQDLIQAVEPISSSFRPEQIIISLAAGIPLRRLKKLLPQCTHLTRVMANTPARVRRGTFGFCTALPNAIVDLTVERLFKPLGFVVKLEEGEAFEAFTVATSAGVGFVFELMIYWQEWLEERGIDPSLAQQLTVHTFAGTAELALQSAPLGLQELQSKVTSKKGVTAAGLESMRELEVERPLRYSFEKAALRDRELSQS